MEWVTGRAPRVPILVLEATVGDQGLVITSLTTPHRSRDSYFRDSEDLTGTPFDATSVGQALAGARPTDATPYYRHTPADLSSASGTPTETCG